MINPGLYIHIPFCRAKCPYCDFYSVSDLRLKDQFLTALATEAGIYEQGCGVFDSLYVGGGTPTVLSTSGLSKLIKTVQKRFVFKASAETTIEANPADITEKTAETLLELGFNRVSLGIQSFSNKDLYILGRKHTKEQALKSINILRRKGFKNLSLDLIYAVPGQTVKSWNETLATALGFESEHISCYQLTVKENTPFFNLYNNSDKKLPGEYTQKKFFLSAVEMLSEKGYVHYEISNYAKKENLKACHNEKYWNHSPYLGLGPSAHSMLDKKRWWNSSCVLSYIKSLKKGLPPVAGQEVLEKEQIALESLFLGFRTKNGFDLSILDAFTDCGKALNKIVNEGFAEIRHNRVLPTLKGMLFADAIPKLLI